MDTDEFLEHHGIKGMRWGVINKHPEKAAFNNLSTGKKIGAGVAGVGTMLLGQAFIGRHFLSSPARAVVSGLSFAAGAHLTSNLLQKHSRKKMSEITKSKSQKTSSEHKALKVKHLALKKDFEAFSKRNPGSGKVTPAYTKELNALLNRRDKLTQETLSLAIKEKRGIGLPAN